MVPSSSLKEKLTVESMSIPMSASNLTPESSEMYFTGTPVTVLPPSTSPQRGDEKTPPEAGEPVSMRTLLPTM